ncbi:MAG TPA: glutaredoxin-like protein NrdH [Lactobacillaceae bacterium]|jgi:glutaredoxin-like protein NrdH
MATPDITLYTRTDCVQCRMTEKFLDAQGIGYKNINIDVNPEYIDALKAAGHRQTPVVDIDGIDTFTGFRPDILRGLTA